MLTPTLLQSMLGAGRRGEGAMISASGGGVLKLGLERGHLSTSCAAGGPSVPAGVYWVPPELSTVLGSLLALPRM